MTRVQLLFTVHYDTGAANVPALQAMLQRLRPDVIFLELPPGDLSPYLNGPRPSLELRAALGYRDIRPVELVPVDLPPPGHEFLRSVECLFDYLESSPEYMRLRSWNDQYVATYGFAYLNSADGARVCSTMEDAIQTTVEASGDARLVAAYHAWTRAHALRERAMIDRVHEYATQSPFGRGLLLVGAAHRRSLISSLRQEERGNAAQVRWEIEDEAEGMV